MTDRSQEVGRLKAQREYALALAGSLRSEALLLADALDPDAPDVLRGAVRNIRLYARLVESETARAKGGVA